MRILIVNTYYYPEIVGGAEISVKKLAENLAKTNEVFVLCSSSSEGFEKINSVKVIRFKPHNLLRLKDYNDINKKNNLLKLKKFLRHYLDIYNHFNYKCLSDIIEEIKPDVIHTNGLYEITPIIWKVAKKYNVKVLHTFRDYYLICRRATMLSKSKKNICNSSNFFCYIRKVINRHMLKKYVDYVTAPSKKMLEVLNNVVKTKKAACVYNAIEFDIKEVKSRCIAKADKVIKCKKIKFVYLGALEKHKGVEWLIKEFENVYFENVELHIAGKGKLQEIIQNIQDPRVFYHGFLDEKQLNELLLSCDVLICPSLWNEPFGRVVLDAYKNAMPVVASNYGALPEIVDDKCTGEIVSTDEGKLKSVIEKMENDRFIIKKYILNIPYKMMEYDLDKQTSIFQRLYEEMLKG